LLKEGGGGGRDRYGDDLAHTERGQREKTTRSCDRSPHFFSREEKLPGKAHGGLHQTCNGACTCRYLQIRQHDELKQLRALLLSLGRVSVRNATTLVQHPVIGSNGSTASMQKPAKRRSPRRGTLRLVGAMADNQATQWARRIPSRSRRLGPLPTRRPGA